jgi:Arc/MetJ family transcription regulator
MSRTTLHIDPKLLEEAMQLSGAKSKTDVINMALDEFVRRRERELLLQQLGSFELNLDPEELRRLRRAG